MDCGADQSGVGRFSGRLAIITHPVQETSTQPPVGGGCSSEVLLDSCSLITFVLITAALLAHQSTE